MRPARRAIAAAFVALAAIAALALANSFLGRAVPVALDAARDAIAAAVTALPLLFALAPLVIYAAAALLFVPAALWLSIAAGFCLGLSAIPIMDLAVASGDFLAFLLARSLWKPAFERRYGERLRGFRAEIEARGWRYLLGLRLMPGVPYGLINAAAALAGARPRDQLLTTLAGFLPACSIYVWAGDNLRRAGAGGALFPPEALIALAVLALALIAPRLLSVLRKDRCTGTRA
jgi:uncharacterized membrane protein YdjX (TVP38/TMEM64 family)